MERSEECCYERKCKPKLKAGTRKSLLEKGEASTIYPIFRMHKEHNEGGL